MTLAIVPFMAAAPATSQEIEAARLREIERLITAAMAEGRIPGVSVAIVLDGKLSWSNGYGFADLENFVPATPRTVYRSASIGKPITATAAMQLAESGALDLDAPIRRYCPAFPQKRWPVTARHLLAHLGGIRGYVEATADREIFNLTRYESVEASLGSFADDPLVHPPGSEYLYSSHGYTLLGCAIEGASGESLMAYLREYIFDPAGMESTREDDPYAIIARRAEGYALGGDGELRNARPVDMSNRLPAGGYVTTAEDLARFAAAAMGDELIDRGTLERMLTRQRTTDGTVIPYGLGWGLFPGEKWYGEREAFHGGMTPGVSGMLYMLPDRGFAVVLLMNREGVEGRTQMAADLARIALGLDGGGR